MFAGYEIVPDVLNDVSKIMFHRDAELAVARAAASTAWSQPVDDGHDAHRGPRRGVRRAEGLQIYILKDRDLTAEFVARCKEAGFHGLALTVDTPVAGNRERDRTNGLSLPPRLTARSLLSSAVHPG